MILFLGGLALLVVGYFTYGRLVERIVGLRAAASGRGFMRRGRGARLRGLCPAADKGLTLVRNGEAEPL